MKQRKLKWKLRLLQIGSFIATSAPLMIVVIMNWGAYAGTPAQSIKLGAGIFIVMFFLFLKVIGKLRMPRRVITFGIIFALSYLLQAVLYDLCLLSGIALFGECLDLIFFQRPIKLTKENILVGKTADATTQQVEEVIKKYIGNGRV